MTAILSKQLPVPLSLCDHTARLSFYGAVAQCMDIAADHAEQLDLGSHALSKQHRFWLAVRTKIRFTRRPKLSEEVTLSTWPQVPARARCVRQYAIEAQGERIMSGKTEWAMMDLASGKLCDVSAVYGDIDFCTDEGCTDAFSRVSEGFEPQQCIGQYTVSSADIDLGHHMNNTAYVRALFSMFTCAQLDEMDLHEAEFVYRAPCFEGETLQVFVRKVPQGIEAAFVKQDGKAAMLARLLS